MISYIDECFSFTNRIFLACCIYLINGLLINHFTPFSFRQNMASRATKMSKKAKVAIDSVKHPPFMKMFIPAQQAKPAPPLGPQLGKVVPLHLLDQFASSSAISTLPTFARTSMNVPSILSPECLSLVLSLLMYVSFFIVTSYSPVARQKLPASDVTSSFPISSSDGCWGKERCCKSRLVLINFLVTV